MAKSAPRVLRRKSFVAEVSARVLERSAEVEACEERTAAEVMTLGGVGRIERAARIGWLRAKCRRCGRCELAG